MREILSKLALTCPIEKINSFLFVYCMAFVILLEVNPANPKIIPYIRVASVFIIGFQHRLLELKMYDTIQEQSI